MDKDCKNKLSPQKEIYYFIPSSLAVVLDLDEEQAIFL